MVVTPDEESEENMVPIDNELLCDLTAAVGPWGRERATFATFEWHDEQSTVSERGRGLL